MPWPAVPFEECDKGALEHLKSASLTRAPLSQVPHKVHHHNRACDRSCSTSPGASQPSPAEARLQHGPAHQRHAPGPAPAEALGVVAYPCLVVLDARMEMLHPDAVPCVRRGDPFPWVRLARRSWCPRRPSPGAGWSLDGAGSPRSCESWPCGNRCPRHAWHTAYMPMAAAALGHHLPGHLRGAGVSVPRRWHPWCRR